VLYRQGDYAAAETHCHRGLAILLEHGPTMFQSNEIRVEVTLILAQCRYAQGQHAEAIQHLRELLATVDDPTQQAKINEILVQFQ